MGITNREWASSRECHLEGWGWGRQRHGSGDMPNRRLHCFIHKVMSSEPLRNKSVLCSSRDGALGSQYAIDPRVTRQVEPWQGVKGAFRLLSSGVVELISTWNVLIVGTNQALQFSSLALQTQCLPKSTLDLEQRPTKVAPQVLVQLYRPRKHDRPPPRTSTSSASTRHCDVLPPEHLYATLAAAHRGLSFHPIRSDARPVCPRSWFA